MPSWPPRRSSRGSSTAERAPAPGTPLLRRWPGSPRCALRNECHVYLWVSDGDRAAHPRSPALRLGDRGAALHPLPRRGVGSPGARRPHAVRVPGARGRAGRAVVVDGAPEARGLSPGVRRVRPRPRGALPPGAHRGAAPGPGHHPQPGQGAVRGAEREGVPRGAARARLVRRIRLELRRGQAAPAPAAHAEAGAGDDAPSRMRSARRSGRAGSASWAPPSATPSCRHAVWWTTTSRGAFVARRGGPGTRRPGPPPRSAA